VESDAAGPWEMIRMGFGGQKQRVKGNAWANGEDGTTDSGHGKPWLVVKLRWPSRAQE